MTGRHRPDCRDKSCSGCSTQAETQRLKARIEELERELRELRLCDCGKPLTPGACPVCDNDE